MIIPLLLVLLANSVFADETGEIVNCEENKISLEATTLAENFAGKDCTSKMDLRELKAKVSRLQSSKKFCKDCVVTPLGSEQNFADKEKYAGAVVGELKKELSFITQDLLQIRESSFKLDATLSCNLDHLSSKTICANGKAPVGKIINSLKESLGNELADTFKPNKTPLNGLLKRKPLTCDKMDKYEVSDQGILAARTKYLESLLTPDFISDLNKQLDKDPTYRSEQLGSLKSHPIFRDIGNSPESLKRFVTSALKGKDNSEIIKIMNKTAEKENFSKKLTERCQGAISKVATALETIYCEKTTLYSEDKFGIDKLNNFKNENSDLNDRNLFKSFCIDLNKSEEKENNTKPFNLTQFVDDLNKNIPDDNKDESWATFHNDAHRTFYNQDKEAICLLIPPATPSCDDPSISNSQNCQMLKFLKDSDKPSDSSHASNDSRDSVNNIFRSMISGGDFTPETKITLQEAGILPGGKPDDTKSTSYFYDKQSGKSISSSSMPAFNNEKTANQVPMQNGKKQIDQTPNTQDNLANFQDITGSNSNSTHREESNSKLSSNQRQNILDKLMRSKKNDNTTINDVNSIKRTTGSKKSTTNDKMVDEGNSFNNESFKTYQNEKGNIADNTRVNKTNQTGFTSNTKQATVDPTFKKKNESYNKAIMQALDRTPAGDTVQNTTFVLSKTDKGLNKIEIKVPDESILEKRVPELELKIKKYLDDSGQSLLGAKNGEAYFVKLGGYDIKVAINDHGVYVADCISSCPTLSDDYKNFLSNYFNEIKKGKVDVESLRNELPVVKPKD